VDYRRPSVSIPLSVLQTSGLALTSAMAMILAMVFLSGCSPSPADTRLDMPHIARWAQAETDLPALLSQEPNECLHRAKTTAIQNDIYLGRLAFRSPFLLGGQAARRGLTCQACHTQGARNPHFFVIGLSDAPGNADVTSFHFSDALGDEVFNPVSIPSLSDDERGVDYDEETQALEAFVMRLITKEFTGPRPEPEVFRGLMQYLRHLDNMQCQTLTLEKQELLAHKIKVITESFQTLKSSDFDGNTINFMTAALRRELGQLYKRFPNHQQIQNQLSQISQALNSRGGDISSTHITKAADLWASMPPLLTQNYKGSLFHPNSVVKWAAAP